MSSDEEDFNLEVSGDESDFAPEPAAKKAPAKKVCVASDLQPIRS